MHSRTIIWLSMTWLAISAIGCAWVSLTPEAESVRVARSAEDVASCTKLGAIQSQTRARVGVFARGTETISKELLSLARNSAAEMGANTVVAQGSPSVEGRQTFTAYRCP